MEISSSQGRKATSQVSGVHSIVGKLFIEILTSLSLQTNIYCLSCTWELCQWSFRRQRDRRSVPATTEKAVTLQMGAAPNRLLVTAFDTIRIPNKRFTVASALVWSSCEVQPGCIGLVGSSVLTFPLWLGSGVHVKRGGTTGVHCVTLFLWSHFSSQRWRYFLIIMLPAICKHAVLSSYLQHILS